MIVFFLISFAISLAFHMIGHGQLSNDHMIAYLSPFVFLGIVGVYGHLLRLSGITVPANAAKSWALKIVVLVMFCGALIFGMDTQQTTLMFSMALQDVLGLPEKLRVWHSVSALMLLLLFAAELKA